MDQDTEDQISSTTARTDTECGNENLPEHEERRKAIETLKALYARGIVSHEEFTERMRELQQDLPSD